MPYRRKYGRRKKRPVRKRGAMVRYKAVRTAFPKVMKTKLRFVEQSYLDPAGSGFSTRMYTATSVYDPVTAAGGGQPRFFDQIMPMYDHYIVLGAKCTVTACSTDNTNTGVVSLGIYDGNIQDGSVNDYLEYNHGHFKILKTNTSGSPTVLTSKYSPSFLGKNNPLNTAELKGTVSSNPTENAYFHFMVAPLDVTINIGRVNFITNLEYIVAFVEPKHPSAS